MVCLFCNTVIIWIKKSCICCFGVYNCVTDLAEQAELVWFLTATKYF